MKPAETILPAGTQLFRVHGRKHPANAANPGHGSGGRFHFFDDASGRRVPSLYAAVTPQAAVTEALFRDVPIRAAGLRTLSKARLEEQALSEIRPRRDLRLIELHHPGLSRLGLEPHEITTTPPTHYPRTRRWARALYASGSREGLVWMSRLYNTMKAYFFFGDRVADIDWEAPGPAHPLWEGTGLAFVYRVAEEAGITITES